MPAWREIVRDRFQARAWRDKVLGVKTGSNPNSSSLGVDVTLLLAAGVAAGLLCQVGGVLVRWACSRRKDRPA